MFFFAHNLQPWWLPYTKVARNWKRPCSHRDQRWCATCNIEIHAIYPWEGLDDALRFHTSQLETLVIVENTRLCFILFHRFCHSQNVTGRIMMVLPEKGCALMKHMRSITIFSGSSGYAWTDRQLYSCVLLRYWEVISAEGVARSKTHSRTPNSSDSDNWFCQRRGWFIIACYGCSPCETMAGTCVTVRNSRRAEYVYSTLTLVLSRSTSRLL